MRRVVVRGAFLPWLTAQSAAEIAEDPEAGHILECLAQQSGLIAREAGLQPIYRYADGFRIHARELARLTLSGEELRRLLWRATEMMERELMNEAVRTGGSHTHAPDAPPDMVRIRALGGFSILINGEPLPKQRKAAAKPLALIKALIALGAGGIPAYRLADVLWPDADGDCALARLNATLHRARKLLGVRDAVVVREGLISLNRAVVSCDVFEFERVVSAMEEGVESPQGASEHLLLSYPGTLLPEHSSEAWVQPCRARLAAKFTSAVLRLGARLQAEGNMHAAQCLYLEAISREPLSFVLEGFLSQAKLKAS